MTATGQFLLALDTQDDGGHRIGKEGGKTLPDSKEDRCVAHIGEIPSLHVHAGRYSRLPAG
ncbi:MAG TPA: hypothetical protein VIJ07_18655 [Dermatophilaceae bacterium]